MKITIEVTDFEFKNNKIRISDLLYTGRLSLVNVPQHIRSDQTWFYSECIHRAVHTKDLQLFLDTLRIVKRDADELKGTERGNNAHYTYDAIKSQIPYGVGVLVPESGILSFLKVIKKPKRIDRKRSIQEMLLMMFRSANRDRYRI